jgi:hypothetical protein
MTREVYFVCATPGTTGNFVANLLCNLLGGIDPSTRQWSFQETTPEVLTPAFYYDNVLIPETGNVVINIPFTPNYEKLNLRFPNCKIIVLTHSLLSCRNIALSYFKNYYIDAYEFGAEPFFRRILREHANLFSNTDAAPWELNEKERHIFHKILSHQKLLDGFHSLEIPADPNVLEIKFEEFHFNTALVEQKLELFTGRTFSPTEKERTKQLVTTFVQNYLYGNRDVFN